MLEIDPIELELMSDSGCHEKLQECIKQSAAAVELLARHSSSYYFLCNLINTGIPKDIPYDASCFISSVLSSNSFSPAELISKEGDAVVALWPELQKISETATTICNELARRSTDDSSKKLLDATQPEEVVNEAKESETPKGSEPAQSSGPEDRGHTRGKKRAT
jgi:hypothetical protein